MAQVFKKLMFHVLILRQSKYIFLSPSVLKICMNVLKKPACLPVIDMTCILDLTQSIGYTTSQRQAPPKPPLNTIGATPGKHRHPKQLKRSQSKNIQHYKQE